jgi:hypothetical protein
MSFPGSTLRKRPSQFDDPDFMNSLAGPRVGPDLAAQPVQAPQFAPLPQLPPMENRSSGGQVAGEALGRFAGAGLNRLMSSRSPDVGPQPGGNPLGDLQRSGGGKFLGMFGGGGEIEKPGDAAIVGDSGPELLRKLRGGKVAVTPLNVGPNFGERLRAAAMDALQPRPVESAPAPNTLKSFGGFGASDPAMTAPQTQGQSPAPTAETQPPTLARSPFVGLRPEATVPQVENDPFKTRLQSAIQMPPGYAGEGVQRAPGDVVSRERIADPRAFVRKRLDEIDARPVNQNTNSRGGGALRSAGRLALRTLAQTGNPVAALGAAATGFGVGLADKTLDERLGEQADATRMRGRLASMDAREAEGLKLEDQRAGVRLKNAQAGYAEQRPDLEAAKQAGVEHNRRLASFYRRLQLYKGQELDPNNPVHAALLTEGADLGVQIDPDSWNNAASNFVSVEELDPDNPTQTRKGQLNRATGQVTYYGRGKYVQPVNPETGMTPYQTGNLKLGGARFGETQRHNRVTEAQGGERIGISRQGLSLRQAAQDNRFDEQTRKRFDAASTLAAQAERYAEAAESVNLHSKYIDPETKEEKVSSKRMIDSQKLGARARALRRQLFAQYPDVFEQGADGRVRMTQEEYRSMFPSLGGGYVGDAQSIGVDLYDADKTGQGTPVQSPMRRPARRGGSGGGASPSAADDEDPNIRAYADQYFGGDYAKAQAAVKEQRRKKGGH